MTPADLQRHIRYSNWASRLLMDAVRALPPGELEKPTGISHHSIPLSLSYLALANFKPLANSYPVDRTLVGVAVRRSHLEIAGRDSRHSSSV